MSAHIVPTMYYPVNINGNIVRMPLMMNIDKVTDSDGKKTISMEDVEKKIKEMCKNCDGNITEADKKELLKSVKQSLKDSLKSKLDNDPEIIAKKQQIINSYEQIEGQIQAIKAMKQDILQDQQHIESIRAESEYKLREINNYETQAATHTLNVHSINSEITAILSNLKKLLTEFEGKKQQYDSNLAQFKLLLDQKIGELSKINISDSFQELDSIKQQAQRILQEINETNERVNKFSAEIATGTVIGQRQLDSINRDVEQIKKLTTEYEELQQGIEVEANQIIKTAQQASTEAQQASTNAEEAATMARQNNAELLKYTQDAATISEQIRQLLTNSTTSAERINEIVEMVKTSQQDLLLLQQQLGDLQQQNIKNEKEFKQKFEEIMKIITFINSTKDNMGSVIESFTRHQQQYLEMTAKLGESQRFFKMNLNYYFNFTIVVISMVKVLVKLFSGPVQSSLWGSLFGAKAATGRTRQNDIAILNDNLLNVVKYLNTSLNTIIQISENVPEGVEFDDLDNIKEALEDLKDDSINFDQSTQLQLYKQWEKLKKNIKKIQALQPQQRRQNLSDITVVNKYQVGGYNYNYLEFAKSVCSSFL
jgi:chromosome segregation ATPase